ncbi:MAG: DUF805 domain-containing protein [Hyphomicrobiaceae bacterium]|nr:DUF805 domain-containing protein [Hyphomicrobiaceae bacterium]
MNPFRLFLGFSGRIGRRSFVFAVLLLAAASPVSLNAILSSNPLADLVPSLRRLGPAGLVWSFALLIMIAALMTKRLHDRGKSGLYAGLFYLPAALQLVTFFTGITPLTQQVALWSGLIAAWIGATGLWFLVELGFYPGEQGPNIYGPDRRSRA